MRLFILTVLEALVWTCIRLVVLIGLLAAVVGASVLLAHIRERLSYLP